MGSSVISHQKTLVLWSSVICIVLMASRKFSADCSFVSYVLRQLARRGAQRKKHGLHRYVGPVVVHTPWEQRKSVEFVRFVQCEQFVVKIALH